MKKLKNINIIPPVKDVYVTQGFGFNYVDFYAKMGLKGHPGIDFRAKHGCKIYAAHDGVVSFAGRGKDGGIGVELWNKGENFKTFYYHHKKNLVKKGQEVKQGDNIALADNTGKYTTASHEHFELYFCSNDGKQSCFVGNGYKGSVDPAIYFKKNWDKTNAYHRYGRKQDWLAEFKMRFKNIWLHDQLNKRGAIKKIFDTSFINALVYGGWGFEDVINDAMWENWAFIKKDDYLKGITPFLR